MAILLLNITSETNINQARKCKYREESCTFGLVLRDQKDTSVPFLASDMAMTTQKDIIKMPNTMLSQPPLP